MFEINKTLLYVTMATCLYVGYKVGRKVERIKNELEELC